MTEAVIYHANLSMQLKGEVGNSGNSAKFIDSIKVKNIIQKNINRNINLNLSKDFIKDKILCTVTFRKIMKEMFEYLIKICCCV